MELVHNVCNLGLYNTTMGYRSSLKTNWILDRINFNFKEKYI